MSSEYAKLLDELERQIKIRNQRRRARAETAALVRRIRTPAPMFKSYLGDLEHKQRRPKTCLVLMGRPLSPMVKAQLSELDNMAKAFGLDRFAKSLAADGSMVSDDANIRAAAGLSQRDADDGRGPVAAKIKDLLERLGAAIAAREISADDACLLEARLNRAGLQIGASR
jgi:hypothetical protein